MGAKKGTQQQQRPKPVLCDPFWLENVVMSREVVMTFQMDEERDLETILAADRERLKAMVQPPLVYAQLHELFSLVGGDRDDDNDGETASSRDCIELAKLELEKVSITSSYEDSASEEEEDEDDEEEVEEENENNEESAGESDTVVQGKLARRRSRLRKLNIFLEAEAPFPLPDRPRLGLSTIGRDTWRSSGLIDLNQWAQQERPAGGGTGTGSDSSSPRTSQASALRKKEEEEEEEEETTMAASASTATETGGERPSDSMSAFQPITPAAQVAPPFAARGSATAPPNESIEMNISVSEAEMRSTSAAGEHLDMSVMSDMNISADASAAGVIQGSEKKSDVISGSSDSDL